MNIAKVLTPSEEPKVIYYRLVETTENEVFENPTQTFVVVWTRNQAFHSPAESISCPDWTRRIMSGNASIHNMGNLIEMTRKKYNF